MKKRLLGLLLCFTLFSMSILTGCSLFTQNTELYYNTIVATLVKDDRTIEITKQELIEMYMSYGSMYEQYYGYSTEEAYQMSLTLVENNKISIVEGEKIVQERGGLTKKEKSYIWQETMDALLDNFDRYYQQIIEAEDESESDDITFEGYQKTAKIENGQIVRENVPTKVIDEYDYDESNAHDYSNEEDKKLIYTNLIGHVTSGDENYREAFEDYKQALISSEQGLNLSTDTPSLFEREIERLSKLMYETYMSTVYSEQFETYDEASYVTMSDILALYSSKVRRDYVQYQIEDSSEYDSTIQSNAAGVYYYKNGEEDTKYFTVANILIMFDETQQEKYNEIYERFYGQSPDEGDPPEELVNSDVSYDGSYSRTDFENDLTALYNQLKPVVRQKEGESNIYKEVESNLTQDTLLQNIKTQLSNESNLNNKADLINQYIYMYNEDEGMFNAESCYVVGVDSNGEGVSSFVQSFEDAAIALYNNGQGKFGDVSPNYVRSNYGLHIIIYTGPAQNENIAKLLTTANENFTLSYSQGDENDPDSAIYTLYHTRVNPLVDKTYFDVLYDEIYQDDAANLQSLDIEELRNEYAITHFVDRYSDLF